MSFADFAILCRTRSQFPTIRDALHRRGIPCQIVGDTPFFMEPGIRPACYLALAAAGLATGASSTAAAPAGAAAPPSPSRSRFQLLKPKRV